jgi:NAD-dependent deacetylase
MKFKNIVVLTGAGISADSGIKTFREAGGLWENYPIEEVATPEGFRKNPGLVYQFYNERKKQLSLVHPNLAHQILAQVEERLGDGFSLITQNVDNLHERAGSKNIFHMHGELTKVRCSKCQEVFTFLEDLNSSHSCFFCKSPGTLRPHIVWFGEIPLYMKEIEKLLKKCDLFISVGTSNQVYPAAGFSQLTLSHGARNVEINLEETATSDNFHETILGKAGEGLKNFFGDKMGLL